MPASPPRTRISSSSGARSKYDGFPPGPSSPGDAPVKAAAQVVATSSMKESFSQPVVIPNDHFTRPKPPPPLPWERPFLERKALSKDPRMAKQCRDEAQWKGTMVEGVWQEIRKFAPATADWYMNKAQMGELFTFWGLGAGHLLDKIFGLLAQPESGSRGGPPNTVNGLVLCKYIELVLGHPEHREVLLRHCYSLFDKRDGVVSVPLIEAAELVDPAAEAAAGKKAKKKKGSGAPTTMKCGAAARHVNAMKVMVSAIRRADPDLVTYEEFAAVAFEPEHAYFVAACAPQVVEVIGSRCAPPLGTLPLLSMRWLATAEPVPAGDVMYDADIALLRVLEAAGGENAKPPGKKKRGAGSPSPAKKK